MRRDGPPARVRMRVCTSSSESDESELDEAAFLAGVAFRAGDLAFAAAGFFFLSESEPEESDEEDATFFAGVALSAGLLALAGAAFFFLSLSESEDEEEEAAFWTTRKHKKHAHGSSGEHCTSQINSRSYVFGSTLCVELTFAGVALSAGLLAFAEDAGVVFIFLSLSLDEDEESLEEEEAAFTAALTAAELTLD